MFFGQNQWFTLMLYKKKGLYFQHRKRGRNVVDEKSGSTDSRPPNLEVQEHQGKPADEVQEVGRSWRFRLHDSGRGRREKAQHAGLIIL